MQQTERLLVLYKQEGTAGHLACGGSTLWPGADDHNRRITLGCAGLPRHPQPHTTDPLPMVLPRFQSVCLDLPNWGRGGGDKRVGRETRTPPAPENTDVKEKAACCSCPYNTSIVIIRGHVFMTRRRRRCTCARESTRPPACEAIRRRCTCAPTVVRRWQDWTRRTSLGLQCREALWLPPSHATTAICPSQAQPAQNNPH